MKNTRDYSKLEGDAKRQQAVKDVMEYIGIEHFTEALIPYVQSCIHVDQVHAGFGMFVGVEGYPCTAMWETYGNKTQPKETTDNE